LVCYLIHLRNLFISVIRIAQPMIAEELHEYEDAELVDDQGDEYEENYAEFSDIEDDQEEQ
jgi:hypothetical protein